LDTAHRPHRESQWKPSKPSAHRLPEIQIIAGNVATYEGARDLIALGIDGLKVGIGPGSICTTRVVTGAGVPQLTAIMEAARAAKGTSVPIIADGGIKYSGDNHKGHLPQARPCVMIGSLFAALKNLPARPSFIRAARSSPIAAMGSIGAMNAGSDRYSVVQDAS